VLFSLKQDISSGLHFTQTLIYQLAMSFLELHLKSKKKLLANMDQNFRGIYLPRMQTRENWIHEKRQSNDQRKKLICK
jgi:hypothetical protein